MRSTGASRRCRAPTRCCWHGRLGGRRPSGAADGSAGRRSGRAPGTTSGSRAAPSGSLPELTQSLALIAARAGDQCAQARRALEPDRPRGGVMVHGSRCTRRLSFAWSGRSEGGPAVNEPTAQGFGLTVLQAAAADVGARRRAVDFDERGLCLYPARALRAAAEAPLVYRLRSGSPRRPGRAGAEVADAKARGSPHSRRRGRGAGRAAAAGRLGERRPRRGRPGALAGGRACRSSIDEDIDVALVDVSLGRDTSAPIADQLLAQQHPVCVRDRLLRHGRCCRSTCGPCRV